ncbi:hypothetical protein ACI2KC_09505 [Pseudomonas monteilii]
MIERLTIHELKAVLQGVKPSDLRPGESIAEYLHRGIQRLATERDDVRRDRDGLLERGAHAL